MEFRLLVSEHYNADYSNCSSGVIIDKHFDYEKVKDYFKSKYVYIFLVDGKEIKESITSVKREKLDTFLELLFNVDKILDLMKIKNFECEQKIRELEKENRDLIERLSFYEEEC